MREKSARQSSVMHTTLALVEHSPASVEELGQTIAKQPSQNACRADSAFCSLALRRRVPRSLSRAGLQAHLTAPYSLSKAVVASAPIAQGRHCPWVLARKMGCTSAQSCSPCRMPNTRLRATGCPPSASYICGYVLLLNSRFHVTTQPALL